MEKKVVLYFFIIFFQIAENLGQIHLIVSGINLHFSG